MYMPGQIALPSLELEGLYVVARAKCDHFQGVSVTTTAVNINISTLHLIPRH